MNPRGRARAWAVAAAAGVLIVPSAAARAEGPTMPGMCNGVRNAPSMVLNAHANGRSSAAGKYILNLETDPEGIAEGALIVGTGVARVQVDQICRFWQHLPGMQPGGGGHETGEGGMDHDSAEGHVPGEEAEGATIAHAVGIGSLRDGARVLVRTDVRGTEEGTFFRVRYREMGQHGGEEGHDATAEGEPGQTHDDESWTRIPGEGWAPLKMLKLRPVE
jgi:hypothetical protein